MPNPSPPPQAPTLIEQRCLLCGDVRSAHTKNAADWRTVAGCIGSFPFQESSPTSAADLGKRTLQSFKSGLLAIEPFLGDGRHSGRCNGDDDGPCDCGYVDPRDVVEALIQQLPALESAIDSQRQALLTLLQSQAAQRRRDFIIVFQAGIDYACTHNPTVQPDFNNGAQRALASYLASLPSEPQEKS